MRNRIFALAVSAALMAMSSACATVADPKAASDTDRARSSWCQGDRLISFSPADRAGQDDPGNQFDSEPTLAEVRAHNARLRAACPDSSEP